MENEEIVTPEEIVENAGDNGVSDEADLGDLEVECEACADEEAQEVAGPGELERLQAELEVMKSLAQRTQADFDNYRKRNVDMVQRARYDGKTDVILEILPVVDNFDRALPLISDESVREGVEKIAKQFTGVLEKLGVKEIEAEGKPFDPDFHNAVFTEEVEGVEPDTVTGVLQKGYVMDDKVIRYAMVKVSK